MNDDNVNPISDTGTDIKNFLDESGIAHLYTIIMNHISSILNKITNLTTTVGNKQDKLTGGIVGDVVHKSSTGLEFKTRVGKSTAGETVTLDGSNVVCGFGAEIFNDYTSNIASGSNSHAEGSNTVASGGNSHAEGWETIASGRCSCAQGYKTTASGDYSHAEGSNTVASGTNSHVEGSNNTISSSYSYSSHAEGNGNLVLNVDSGHTEGGGNIVSSHASHAENGGNLISNIGYVGRVKSFTTNTNTITFDTTFEGYSTFIGKISSNLEIYIISYKTIFPSASKFTVVSVSGDTITIKEPLTYLSTESLVCIPTKNNDYEHLFNHCEGHRNIVMGKYSHAEGNKCIAINWAAHAEGYRTKATYYSHAEGDNTNAQGQASHAECSDTTAEGNYSHAEGIYSRASGLAAHVEGFNCSSHGKGSHAGGIGTIAFADEQTAIGVANVKSELTTDKLIIGKGVQGSTTANCFRVTDTGTYATGSYRSSGADYAELFQWIDDNHNKEDRIGRFVKLNGDRIEIASSSDDYILGIISGNASVIGDVHDDQWQGMYMYDIYMRPIWEDVEIPEKIETEVVSTYEEVEVEIPNPDNPDEMIKSMEFQLVDKEIEKVIPAHTVHRQKLNPNYDPKQTYIPRSERPEWGCVGMIGKIVMIDDGTCQVNGYCTSGENGIATHSDKVTKFRVMTRIDETHIKVVIVP